MSKKKYVKEHLDYISDFLSMGLEKRNDISLDALIDKLKSLEQHYTSQGYRNLRVEEFCKGEYETYTEYLQITGFRSETDKEYEDRLTKESQMSKAKKDRAEAKYQKALLKAEQAKAELEKLKE